MLLFSRRPAATALWRDQIKRLIERLGADKDEPLSNHLINTSIRTAQEKLERRVPKEMPTYSAADWFKYNVGDKANDK